VRDSHADLLEDIRTKKELTDEISDKLKSVVDGYAKSFA
jgi:F-type H+-transporting ATPase subunit alpha